MELWELVENFKNIFAGNNRGHGEFKITRTEGMKAKGSAKTVSSPATSTLWGDHLSGETGLGIVPINEDNACVWGCVDIDEYEGLDLEDLSFKLPLPLVLCRSKSGGAHVFIFTRVPVAASLLRKKLLLVARALGRPNAEVFPKQTLLGPGDIGNWLNMPYFNHESTTRYAIKNGVALTAEEFIAHIESVAVSNQELVAFNVGDTLESTGARSEFDDAPPCLQYYIENGFPKGSMNSALFSMGVYARKKYPEGWEDKVFEYNQQFMGPGTYSEVLGIVKSVKRKNYKYKCKDIPLVEKCDKDRCATLLYGVPLTRSDEKTMRPCILDEVDQPVQCLAPAEGCSDEPYWIFTIEGKNLEVSVEMARSQTFFARGYLIQFHRVLLPVNEKRWVEAINELMAGAEIKSLAPDAGPEGQFMVHLESFCTTNAPARNKDELLIGKVWMDKGRTYFRSSDLMRYLDQQRFRGLRESDIWAILRRNNAGHHDWYVKGKHLACWSVESFTVQDEGFEVIELYKKEKF